MKAIIGGTSLFSSPLFKKWKERRIATHYGEVAVQISGDALFLQRHGTDMAPPHRINHRANVQALKDLAVTEVVAINSVGSLKTSIRPGTFLIPDDFFCPWDIPTFFDREMRFTVPSMKKEAAARLLATSQQAGLDVVAGGTYVQTRGPRLETKAEVRVLRTFGDVVGMTMASEATLCGECDLPYASLCSVDNFCHGIARKALTMDEIHEQAAGNLVKIEGLIRLLLAGGQQ